MFELAAAKAGGGAILVILDADDDCPVELASRIRTQAIPYIRGASLEVVMANREFEAWFLAAAESLAGKRGLAMDIVSPNDPDIVRNAKGWLSDRIVDGRYREVIDQPALTAEFDVERAVLCSRSFRKLVRSVELVFRDV